MSYFVFSLFYGNKPGTQRGNVIIDISENTSTKRGIDIKQFIFIFRKINNTVKKKISPHFLSSN